MYFAGCATLKNQRRFDDEFYSDVLIPLYQSVLDEPKYRGKYLGQRSTFRDGLRYIHLRATWSWDYKWVKTPLRDVCAPREASFQLSRENSADRNRLTISGSVACDEEIASVEVPEDDGVVYSVSAQ